MHISKAPSPRDGSSLPPGTAVALSQPLCSSPPTRGSHTAPCVCLSMVTVAEGPSAWTNHPRRSAASGASFWEGTDASEDLQPLLESTSGYQQDLEGYFCALTHRLVKSCKVRLEDQCEGHPRWRLLSTRGVSESKYHEHIGLAEKV